MVYMVTAVICMSLPELSQDLRLLSLYHIFVRFFFRNCSSFTDFEIAIQKYREIRFLHQFDRAYVSPFSKLFFFQHTVTGAASVRSQKKIRIHANYQVHAGRLSKIIYRTLTIIGSYCMGTLGKCLGLNVGVSSARLTPLPLFLAVGSLCVFSCFSANACYTSYRYGLFSTLPQSL